MNPLRVAQARVVGLIHKERLEEELDEELRFHLAMRTQENIRRGLPAAEATRSATEAFGKVEAIKDACRDVSGGGALEVFWQDVRFATRMLLKDRAFTAVAVLALALGIGANTALFTVLSSVILRPLPYAAPDRIMAIWHQEAGRPETRLSFSYPDFLDLKSRNQSFESLSGYSLNALVVASNGGEPKQVEAALVTSDLFTLLGVKPAIGRSFNRADDERGSRTVLISHELWEKQFDKAANITSAQLQLDGQTYSVIGVMPPDFRFPVRNKTVQFWTTFARNLDGFPGGAPAVTTRRDAHFVTVLGRLKANATPATAAEDASAIAADIAVTFAETNRRLNAVTVVPWLADITRNVRPALLLLIGAAICVLGVACANVANLLLARATTRQKEIALRAALGAGRSRILRQLLTESLLLAMLGALVGLVFALVGTPAIVALLPANFPRASEIVPDAKVLAFAGIIAVITSCVFGFAPAWRSARCDLARVLNDCSRRSTETPRGRRTRNALVVTEMVLAFVLLAAASFLLRALWHLEHAPLGFTPERVVIAEASLPDAGGGDDRPRVAARFAELVQRIGTIPGVESASAVTAPPMGDYHPIADYGIEGRNMLKADFPLSEPHIIEPNYFLAMQIPVLRGRVFDARDKRDALPVVIVNETLAHAAFGDENPIGRKISPGMTDSGVIIDREIVGVVGDVKSGDFAREQEAEVYLPHSQCASTEMTLVVRSGESPETLITVIRGLAKDIDGSLAISDPRLMEDQVAEATAQPRLNSTLLAAFAAVAVLLTAIGVYGLMAYSVAQRRHEIGIRLTLGAPRASIFNMVASEGIRLIGWAVIGGTACTLVAAPFLRAFAYGLAVNAGPILLLVAVVLSTVALLACWLPARHAADDDPLLAIGER